MSSEDLAEVDKGASNAEETCVRCRMGFSTAVGILFKTVSRSARTSFQVADISNLWYLLETNDGGFEEEGTSVGVLNAKREHLNAHSV